MRGEAAGCLFGLALALSPLAAGQEHSLKQEPAEPPALGAAAPALAAGVVCPADCGNGDGVVDLNDLFALLGQWGGPGSCDLDGDGTVSVGDLVILLGEWGSCADLATGACCLPDGSCANLFKQSDCEDAGGFYQGDGSTCERTFVQFGSADCANPFEDISATGIEAPSASNIDDAGDVVPIGFTFDFFGVAHEDIGICSNGYLTFGDDLSDFTNDAIPSTDDPNDLIAPWWDDWAPNTGGTVHYQTLGDPGSRRFIAQWTGVPHFDGSGEATFQAVLYEGSNCIEFRYGAPLTLDSPTVGVESPDGTSGLGIDPGSIASDDCVELCPEYTDPIVCAACCLPDGSCDGLGDADCAAAGGIFLGIGLSCDDVQCIENCPGGGSCFEANGSPGCWFGECCLTVCAVDPYCCNVEWDAACANEAQALCDFPPPCGDASAGSCFEANGTPGCDDGACCETVCTIDPFCCDIAWDSICVGEAFDLCPGAPTTGACCFPDGTCQDLDEDDCIAAIGCWQGVGTACATTVCSVCSPNDVCVNALPIFDGDTDFDTTGASTDGPTHPECQFDGQTYHDIWFDYTATCTGDLTVSTCNQASYDTDLVVYDGCDCNNLVLLDCSDDATGCAGFTSEVVVPVVAGNCYKIRVGGWQDGDFGPGTLTLSCEGVAPVGACCLPDASCADDMTEADCAAADGTFQGAGVICADVDCVPGCPGTGDCFEANGTPGCMDGLCCSLVCDLDPYCCDVEWDELCAERAQDICP